jgi:hypothetical protein
MPIYDLLLKNALTYVFAHECKNKKEAMQFFIALKRMPEDEFKKLFTVKRHKSETP